MNMPAPQNPFETLWALGYRRVVPIIPPGAPISPRSNLFKRIEKGDDARGKSPGVRWPDGSWSGYDWLKQEADERDLIRWRDMGAGIGIRTGAGLHAIDADTLDPGFAKIIHETQIEVFGHLPRRIGRAPKALSPFRCTDDLSYQRIEFGEPDDRGGLERVEILGEGRQFVAWGIHPLTQAPYHWTSRLPPLEELPLFEPRQIAEFMEKLGARLPKARPVVREGALATVPQDSLRGDVGLIRKAVAALPNTGDRFAPREAWLGVGFAIKAALPDMQAEALEIFQEWSARWTEGVNEPEIVEADWRRMKPPFRRGVGWLCRQAEELSGGSFSAAERWFETPAEEPESLFPLDSESTVTATIDGFQWAGAEGPGVPDALVDDLAPYQGILFIGGQSGSGKTFMAIDLAVALTTKGKFLGKDVNERAGVAILAGEGAATLKNRLWAACAARGVDQSQPICWLGSVPNLADASQIPALVARLRAVDSEMREKWGVRLGMVVYDTMAATFALNDENDNSEAGRTIRTLAMVGTALTCLQVPVHHYGKGAETGLRGASAWRGGCDAVLSITCDRNQLTGETKNHWIALAKNRVGEEGPVCPFRLEKVSLGIDAKGRTFTSCHIVPGETDAPLAGDAREREVFEAVRTGDWRSTPHAKEAWIGHVIMRAWGGSEQDAKTILKRWMDSGKLVEKEALSKQRKMRKRLFVAGEEHFEEPAQESVLPDVELFQGL